MYDVPVAYILRIKTKIQSVEIINKLGLNQLPGILLERYDEPKLKSFLTNNKATFYVVRDKTVAASPKLKMVKFDEVIEYCKKCEIEKFTVEVALYNYFDAQILVGEINIQGDKIDYILSNNPILRSGIVIKPRIITEPVISLIRSYKESRGLKK